ncbi:MAG TPA: BadF/BadG/BcrA/BcrD ATPase family protein [Nocardioidaceae bacterium]|nr:BadF/BadG/BcrA/BcrD ATPase family protein [Nocardioidaceae bacterium]
MIADGASSTGRGAIGEGALIAGADVGKTRCRVAIADSDGSRLHTVEGPGAEGLAQPGGVDDATAVVTGLIDKAVSSGSTEGRRVAALAVGAAGAATARVDAQDALALRLHQRTGIEQIAVTSDSVVAHAGALAGASGVVLAVGTGAVTLGIGDDGRDCRVDGWGQWLGDEGSGAWIGREALRTVVRALDGRGPDTTLMTAAQEQFGTLGALPAALAITPELPRTSAAFVPAVVACAAEGDAVAADVLDRAVAAWVESTGVAARAVAATTVACVGGLSSVERLRESWHRALPSELAVVAAQGDAVDGALLLAGRSDLPHERQVRRHEWGTS